MTYGGTWQWEFRGFWSLSEGNPVQLWLDNLPPDHKDEVEDLLNFVRNIIQRPWPEMVFDPLKGEGGISELKVPEIRCFRNGRHETVTYRLYGAFGLMKCCYVLLHTTEKDVKNDRAGKQIARRRLIELQSRHAEIQRLVFEDSFDSEAPTEPQRPN